MSYSLKTRSAAISALNSGQTQAEVSKRFKVSTATLSNWARSESKIQTQGKATKTIAKRRGSHPRASQRPSEDSIMISKLLELGRIEVIRRLNELKL